MKRKISWYKTLIIFSYILSLVYIIRDVYTVFIQQWFTGKYCSWSLVGFVIFTLILIYNMILFDIIKGWWNNND